MPLTLSDFPHEVQVAFFIFDFLPDNWEGMSGYYLGKLWGGVDYLFKVHRVDDIPTILYIMKLWENIIVTHRAEKADKKRKAEERKSAGGGKNFTHNVKG